MPYPAGERSFKSVLQGTSIPSADPKGIATPTVQAANRATVGQKVNPQLETRNQTSRAKAADQRIDGTTRFALPPGDRNPLFVIIPAGYNELPPAWKEPSIRGVVLTGTAGQPRRAGTPVQKVSGVHLLL